jgi:tRNA threonylcarbamoyladenosine biosynthesis protein TsaE
MKKIDDFQINDIGTLENVAAKIIALTSDNSVFCFYGNLGAGKTTLIKLICEKLNVKDIISSPTYPIINEYKTIDNNIIYHIDLYRLKSVQEALNIGLDEYLYSKNLCFIEWPDHFESLLPEDHVKVFIRKLEDENRNIELFYSF